MKTRVLIAPAAYPVTLAEAREWCRLDATDTSQDNTLTMLIAMATNMVETITGRAFVERTLEAGLSSFQQHEIHLPWAPLIGIDSITYTDRNSNVQTIDASAYEIDTMEEPGKVRPAWGQIWPVVGYVFNAVRIRYRAGYVAPGSPQNLADNSYLPAEMRLWMQSRMLSFLDTRAQWFVDGRVVMAQVPRDAADGLLDGLILGTRLF